MDRELFKIFWKLLKPFKFCSRLLFSLIKYLLIFSFNIIKSVIKIVIIIVLVLIIIGLIIVYLIISLN